LSEVDRQRYLTRAIAQSTRVGELARQLLELARLESGVMELRIERFALPELVQDVIQKVELVAQARGYRMTTGFGPALPDVLADIGVIERVLTNLLDNATRHAPPGCEVRVEMRSGGTRVEVEVMDTGPGIPPALREGLFSLPTGLPSAHRPQGTGLGLVIVHRLLKQSGSDIRLLERPGFGAVFGFARTAATEPLP
jgi:signal transduction histidine kinase